MIVKKSEFANCVKRFTKPGWYGADTETTGLKESDTLFSLILADEEGACYFNFNDRPDHLGQRAPDDYILPRQWLEEFGAVFENLESLFFLHNAKFDLRMLTKEGLSVLGTVHDTEVLERVIKNNYLGHKPYSLGSVAKRYGCDKSDAVDEYIKKHGLITKVRVPGKKKLFEEKHFDRVPFSVIAPYGETDGTIVRRIGIAQKRKLEEIDATTPPNRPTIAPLVINEYLLTKACHRVERTGIKINRKYTEDALAHTQAESLKRQQEFTAMTGIVFEDNAKAIAESFKAAGIELPRTRTGKPCTNKATLDGLHNPVADKIREIRTLDKLASTYFSSFTYFADPVTDLIHANMRQGGTETMRFSYSDPNLQNIPKEDDEEDKLKPFIVRKCFEPLNADWCLVPIDFKQQEYRMMADYAGETQLIDAIMMGEDVHDATARLLGITRKQAKTLNFGLLYGMGGAKLAHALKIPLEEALYLRAQYFRKLPNIQRFVRNVMRNGEDRGYIFNWFGFRSHIARREFAYVLPNHIIQGGCAQVVRIAMVRLDDYIRKHQLRSRILVQVHDELLFQVHKSELHHVVEFQDIMENVYVPRNNMKLDCSVEHSWISWGKWDQTKGVPNVTAA